MGKEALKTTLRWLNEDKNLNISKQALINSIVDTEIPDELTAIFDQLESKERKSAPEKFDRYVVEDTTEEVEILAENLLLEFGNDDS